MRVSVGLALSCVCLFAMELNAADVAKGSQPNIVFVMADDLGYTDLACYGSERP